MSSAVAVIDVSPWTDPARHSDSARAAVVHAWDAAFSSTGFAGIVGHGVAEELIRGVNADAERFFRLPLAAKAKYATKYYGDPSGGFSPLGLEAVERSIDGDDSLPPDLVESFLFPFPPALYNDGEEVIPLAQQYHDALLRLLGALHEISAAALGVSLLYFNSHYNPLDSARLRKETTGFYLRFAYYPPITKDEAGPRYGAHTDYECFTILKPDASDWSSADSGGLQVQLQDGEFAPVVVPAHAFVVNGGDLIQRWTNDKWKSAMHRVKKPSVGSAAAAHKRQSIAFFTAPRSEAVITCIEGINGPAKYPPITCGEHVRMKIERTTTSS